MGDIARVEGVFGAKRSNMGYKIRWEEWIWDGIRYNHISESNLPWTSQVPSSSPGIGHNLPPKVCGVSVHNIDLPEITAWPGDPSLLKTQAPAIGSRKLEKWRHANARDTLQGNPGPDSDPEYWVHGSKSKNHWLWALYRE
ncbi:unnamed protein product [Phytophthora fragariaefolia]|uniref:Unnamed protein product n=1 Tax=Phytophthora fragariaefolia TaxID=1490495 RepID=A0A9W6WV31_9STRA|nr:unnamed protein product [Phytophthora fragariaefolia]